MKGFFIFIALVGAFLYWSKGFVQSGQFQNFLDKHPNSTVNPTIEYYWGMTLAVASHRESASYRFQRIIAKYPKSEYAPLAWIEYIAVLDDMGDRGKMLEEARKFMQSDYATHPKAEIIRKKIAFAEHGL